MKILHVLDHSLPHYDGYAFRSAEIIRCQRLRGLATVQVTSAKHVGANAARETVDDIDFHRTTAPGGLYRYPILDQVGVVTSLKARIAELIAAERPDVVHAHSPSLNGMAALAAARVHGIPVVYEIRSFWEDAAVDAGACREGDVRYRLTRQSETYVVKRAQHIVPICRGIADDILARGVDPQRLTVVPNGVDVSRFSAHTPYDDTLAAKYGLSKGHTVGFAGSFFAFEGLQVLIDAAALVARDDPAFRLLLVGDGVERQRLEAHAGSLDVKHQIVFTGRVAHSQINAFYSVMDTLVYPRISMRLTELVTPLKPLEAMASGNLVIASDVGGHRELLRHGETGLLFRAGDPRALADTITSLLKDRELQDRLRREARAHVQRRHDWLSNVDAYISLYQSLIR